MGKNNIDDIYDSDPRINKKVKGYSSISYDKIIHDNLKAIDTIAAASLNDNEIKIIVFSANRNNCFIDTLEKKIPTTIISKSRKGK